MSDADVILKLEGGWISREELSQMLGLPDRAVRSYIEDLNTRLRSHGRCVLSSSSRRGYHIPNPLSEEDVAIANLVLQELKAKAVSIFTRRQAVEDFIKFSQSAKDAQRETQLTLF